MIIALGLLVTILTRPQYIILLNCETTKEASEVKDLLETEGLDYKVSDDGYQISINKNSSQKQHFC